MTDELHQALYEATALTLEGLCFLLPSVDTRRLGPPTLFAARADVSFHGPVRGTLTLRACSDLIQTMSANTLGSRDPPPYQQQLDVLGEVANVICGNLLPALTSGRAIVRLSAPRIRDAGSASGAPGDPSAADVTIAFDEGLADVRLFIEDGTYAPEGSHG